MEFVYLLLLLRGCVVRMQVFWVAQVLWMIEGIEYRRHTCLFEI